MDTQIENRPLTAPGPPLPPPLPGCAGSILVPHWRSEPLPSHLAPSKEEIDKEQYANLPDKLLNTMNKDKKPFTYTPQGVSGLEKGKLDLTEIRSPKMKKRLMANLHEDDDSSDGDRPRSETPDLLTKPQTVPNPRRALTPDVIMLNRQAYVPVLPVLPVKEPVFPNDRNSPNIYRQSPLAAEEQKQQQQALVKQQLQQQPIQKPLITPQIMDSLMFKQLEGLKKSYKPDINTVEAVDSNGNVNGGPGNVSFLYPQGFGSDKDSRSESSIEAANEEIVQKLPEQQPEVSRSKLTVVENNDPTNDTEDTVENEQFLDNSEANENEVKVNGNNDNDTSNSNNGVDKKPSPPPVPPPLPPPTLQQQQYLLKQQQLQQQQQLILQQQQEKQLLQQQQQQQLLYQQQLLQQQQQEDARQRQLLQQQQEEEAKQRQLQQQQQQNYYPQVNGNKLMDRNTDKIIYESNDNVNQKPSSSLWENDVLRHVLDGGLQEELEKFEQISLEAEQSSSRTSTPLQYNRNFYCNEPPQQQSTIHHNNTTHEQTYETIDFEAPTIETAPIKFKDAREMFKRIQDKDKQSEAVSFNAFRRNRSPQPQQTSSSLRDSPLTTQSMWGSVQDWTRYQSPPPTPLSHQTTTYSTNSFDSVDTEYSTQPSDPSLYRGSNIPSKTFQYIKEKTGITDAEVKNYNTRPKPFYLSSPSPTPQPTQSSQQFYRPEPNPPQSSTYGVNVPPPKLDYLETTLAPIPQRKSYIESASMYSQRTYVDEWPESGVDYSSPLGSSKSGSDYQTDYNSPKAAAARRKKLPPSQQECDPTPPKYQGSSIPSRSFRFLQLITGEDIENQYQNNNENHYQKPTISKPKPNIKPTKPPPNIPNPLKNNTQLQPPLAYRTYDDSGTDF